MINHTSACILPQGSGAPHMCSQQQQQKTHTAKERRERKTDLRRAGSCVLDVRGDADAPHAKVDAG